MRLAAANCMSGETHGAEVLEASVAKKIKDVFKVGTFKHGPHSNSPAGEKGRTFHASIDTKNKHHYFAVGKHEGRPLAFAHVAQDKRTGEVKDRMTRGFKKNG